MQKKELSTDDKTIISCFISSNSYAAKLKQIRDSANENAQYLENENVKKEFEGAVKDMDSAIKRLSKFEGITHQWVDFKF